MLSGRLQAAWSIFILLSLFTDRSLILLRVAGCLAKNVSPTSSLVASGGHLTQLWAMTRADIAWRLLGKPAKEDLTWLGLAYCSSFALVTSRDGWSTSNLLIYVIMRPTP